MFPFPFRPDYFQKRYEEYQLSGVRKSLANAVMDGGYKSVPLFTFSDIKKELDQAGVNLKEFSTMGDCDKIEKMWTIFPMDRFKKMIKLPYKCFAKDEGIAKLFKKKADKMRNSNIIEAIERYNLALSFAPKGFAGTASIYGKRGCTAVKLFELNDFLVDTSHALRLGCSKNLEKKIKAARTDFEGLLQSIKYTTGDENWEYLSYRDKIFNIDGNINPDRPAMASYLKIRRDGIHTTSVIVTQDIPAGTTIIVEEPYVTTGPEVPRTWKFDYCNRCFKSITCTIPCQGCVFTVYCSEVCRSEDLKRGHKYSCKCLPYLHLVKLSGSFYLTFLALCKAGPNTLYDMYLRSEWTDENGNVESSTDDGNGEGAISIDLYTKALNLEAGLKYSKWIGIGIWHCVSLINLLALKTPFFKQVEPEDPLKFKMFVTSILLKHSITIDSNIMVWFSRQSEGVRDDTLIPPDTSIPRGLGIYPCTGLLNNSCDPNSTRLHLMNGRVAVVTNRRLFAGDEVTISYALEFQYATKEKRDASLKHFLSPKKCGCVPCKENWPVYSNEMKGNTQYLCQKCTSGQYKNYNLETVQSSWKYLMIPDENQKLYSCRECHDSVTIHAIKEWFWYNLELTQRLVEMNQPLDAIPLLLECAEYFQKITNPPSYETIKCNALLNEAYNQILLEDNVY